MKIEQIICHEWGHTLMAYNLLGMEIIESIEIDDTFFEVYGHTNLSLWKVGDLTNEQKTLILFGGITAEKICKYTKSSYHKGTDWDKIRLLLPNTQERFFYAEKATKILLPYKEILEKITKDTLFFYPTERDSNKRIYYRLFRDEIATMINRYI